MFSIIVADLFVIKISNLFCLNIKSEEQLGKSQNQSVCV